MSGCFIHRYYRAYKSGRRLHRNNSGTLAVLKKLKPECRIDVILEKPAPEYDFIQGIDQIITDDTKPFTYDVMIVVDSVPERCGHANTYVLRAKN